MRKKQKIETNYLVFRPKNLRNQFHRKNRKVKQIIILDTKNKTNQFSGEITIKSAIEFWLFFCFRNEGDPAAPYTLDQSKNLPNSLLLFTGKFAWFSAGNDAWGKSSWNSWLLKQLFCWCRLVADWLLKCSQPIGLCCWPATVLLVMYFDGCWMLCTMVVSPSQLCCCFIHRAVVCVKCLSGPKLRRFLGCCADVIWG